MSRILARHSPKAAQKIMDGKDALVLSRADVPRILDRLRNGNPVVKVTSIHLPTLSDDDMAILSQAIATSVSMGLLPDLRRVTLSAQTASKNALYEIQQLNSFLRHMRRF